MSCKNSLKKNWEMALLSVLLLIISISGCLDGNTPPAGGNIPPSVIITSPTGSEYWAGGSTKEITWIATDENIQETSINLYYSTDGGNSWNQIASDEINDGSYNWTLPIIDSSNVKIKVEAKDNAGNTNSSYSYSTFIIDSTNPIVNNIKIHDTTLDSFNSVSDGDNIIITASVTDGGLNSGDTKFIVADLSSFGYDSRRQADSYDGNTATWTISNVVHKPLTETTRAAVEITAYDPANLSSSITDYIRVYPLKVGVIEFAPQDVIYGELYCYYDENSKCYRLERLKESFSGVIVEDHNFLEIFNNQKIQFYTDYEFPFNGVPRSIYYIEGFFKNQAEKYNYPSTSIFEIEVLGPFMLSENPPESYGGEGYGGADGCVTCFFEKEVENNSINISSYDVLIYAYFHDHGLSGREYLGFISSAGGNSASICLDTSNTPEEDGIRTIAHELAHILGASDQYTIYGCGECMGCCILPDGLADPDKVPLFPQEKASLMCGKIVLNYNESSWCYQEAIDPPFLDDAVINVKTAEEIGWINK